MYMGNLLSERNPTNTDMRWIQTHMEVCRAVLHPLRHLKVLINIGGLENALVEWPDNNLLKIETDFTFLI